MLLSTLHQLCLAALFPSRTDGLIPWQGGILECKYQSPKYPYELENGTDKECGWY